jgi:hypothetical protein
VAGPKKNRFFQTGEKVVVKKKTHLLDVKREQEGIPKNVKAEPIDENVTGIEGEIEGAAYQSPTKGNQWMIPIRVGAGGIISIPEERLERQNRTPSLERNQDGGSTASMSKESISFWRKYFQQERELKELKKKTKRG